MWKAKNSNRDENTRQINVRIFQQQPRIIGEGTTEIEYKKKQIRWQNKKILKTGFGYRT